MCDAFARTDDPFIKMQTRKTNSYLHIAITWIHIICSDCCHCIRYIPVCVDYDHRARHAEWLVRSYVVDWHAIEITNNHSLCTLLRINFLTIVVVVVVDYACAIIARKASPIVRLAFSADYFSCDGFYAGRVKTIEHCRQRRRWHHSHTHTPTQTYAHSLRKHSGFGKKKSSFLLRSLRFVVKFWILQFRAQSQNETKRTENNNERRIAAQTASNVSRVRAAAWPVCTCVCLCVVILQSFRSVDRECDSHCLIHMRVSFLFRTKEQNENERKKKKNWFGLKLTKGTDNR